MTIRVNKWIDRDDESKWCKVCNCPVNFGDANQYVTHIDGKQHRSKLKQQFPNTPGVPSVPTELAPKEPKKPKQEEKIPDWYPPTLHHIIKTFDIHQLRKLQQIIKQNPEVILILDEPRFYNTLCAELLELIYGIVIECNYSAAQIAVSVETKFDMYYNHKEMRIYMCELLCAMCDFPFSIKRRLYAMPENYLKPILVELFTKLLSKLDIEPKQTCDRIIQISDYLRVTKSLDRGELWDAQGVIEQNHFNRQKFAVDIYSEARRSWEHYSAQQKY